MRITRNIRNRILPVLVVFLFIQPAIDVTTSFLVKYTGFSLTAGMIIRIAFLLLAVFYCIIFSRSSYRKYILWYSVAVVAFAAAYLLYMYIDKNASVLFLEIKSLLKCFYFPLLLLCFITILDEQEKSFDPKYFIIPALAYAGLLLLAVVTGTGFFSYTYGKSGTSGWFYAANETGTVIAILFPVLVFTAVATLKKFSIKNLALSLIIIMLYIGIALNIGTKVPMLGILVTFGALFLVYMIKAFVFTDKKRSVIISLLSLVMLALAVAAMPYTAAGKNLQSHMASVNMKGISDFFDDDTANGNGEQDNSTNVILSSRDKYLEKTAAAYDRGSIAAKILGLGTAEIKDNAVEMRKAIEMDFFDVFYQFGILGFFVYFAPLLIIIVRIALTALKRIKAAFTSDTAPGYMTGLLLSLGIAYIAGHVLTAPAVSIYAALFTACLFIMLAGNKRAVIKNGQ